MRHSSFSAASRWACLVAGLLLLAGCWRGAKPPPAPVVAAAPPKVVTPEPPPVETPQAEEPKETPPEPMPPEEPPEPPAPPPIPAEKFLLCAPRGPLVVEFEIWIDGQPQGQVFDQLIDEVLKQADTDGDGRPMWKEVTASPKFRYGQFGNLAFDRDNGPKQIIQQYDVNGNGQVDRSELPRFLTRNAGGARAFSVRSLEQFKDRHGSSPTWQALDSDDNGELSQAELERAAAQLKLYDADDDEILVIDEIRPTADVDPNMNARTLGRSGNFARPLGDHANWDSIRSALENQYALGGNLNADDFGPMREVFDHLDENRDGTLLKKEFPRLNEVAAQLRFRIDFGVVRKKEAPATEGAEEPKEGEEPRPAEQNPTTVKLLSSRLTAEQTGGAAPQIIDFAGRVILRWPGVSLTFVRNDRIATVDFEAQAQQGLDRYDTDKNGYLEAKEVNEQVQAQFARFEALDSDGDEKVYPGEIAAFLRQRQGAQRAQVHMRAQDQEDFLFLALDQNADDRLDAQELETAAERLQKLDASGNGNLTDDELPGCLAIVVARGSVENQNLLFAIGPVEAKAPPSGLPAWFTAMDTSRDGVISAREFLGTAEKFAALDKNGNGFFEPGEIPVTEAKAEVIEPTSAEPAEEKAP